MIDWTKPIELATEPPRPAEVGWVYPDKSGAEVYADWYGDGDRDRQPTDNKGLAYPHLPRVRNVATAPDLAAELAEASRALLARWLGGDGDMEDDDQIERNMRAALAKYEASK